MKSIYYYLKSLIFQTKLNKAVVNNSNQSSRVILDDEDISDLLKISIRNVLEYRKKGILRSYKIEKKYFYFLDEVIFDIKKAGGKNGN